MLNFDFDDQDFFKICYKETVTDEEVYVIYAREE